MRLTDYAGGDELKQVLDAAHAANIPAQWRDMAGGFVWVYAYAPNGACTVTTNAFAIDDDDTAEVVTYYPEHDPLADSYDNDTVDTCAVSDLGRLFITCYNQTF